MKLSEADKNLVIHLVLRHAKFWRDEENEARKYFYRRDPDDPKLEDCTRLAEAAERVAKVLEEAWFEVVEETKSVTTKRRIVKEADHG